MADILLAGLFNSVMFPTSALSDYQTSAAHQQRLQPYDRCNRRRRIAALLEGNMADQIGVQHAFVVPAFCYVYIAASGSPLGAPYELYFKHRPYTDSGRITFKRAPRSIQRHLRFEWQVD